MTDALREPQPTPARMSPLYLRTYLQPGVLEITVRQPAVALWLLTLPLVWIHSTETYSFIFWMAVWMAVLVLLTLLTPIYSTQVWVHSQGREWQFLWASSTRTYHMFVPQRQFPSPEGPQMMAECRRCPEPCARIQTLASNLWTQIRLFPNWHPQRAENEEESFRRPRGADSPMSRARPRSCDPSPSQSRTTSQSRTPSRTPTPPPPYQSLKVTVSSAATQTTVASTLSPSQEPPALVATASTPGIVSTPGVSYPELPLVDSRPRMSLLAESESSHTESSVLQVIRQEDSEPDQVILLEPRLLTPVSEREEVSCISPSPEPTSRTPETVSTDLSLAESEDPPQLTDSYKTADTPELDTQLIIPTPVSPRDQPPPHCGTPQPPRSLPSQGTGPEALLPLEPPPAPPSYSEVLRSAPPEQKASPGVPASSMVDLATASSGQGQQQSQHRFPARGQRPKWRPRRNKGQVSPNQAPAEAPLRRPRAQARRRGLQDGYQTN